VPPTATRDLLRDCFTRWGKPARLRVDNGMPWGSHGDLPTDLALWLGGLGVAVRANPPRRPQHNGVVERSQGTAKSWAEPGRCGSADELQRRLDEADSRQRDLYPSIRGLARIEAYPGLAHSGRAYDLTAEPRCWDLAAAWELLARHVVPRRVDSSGKVSVYRRSMYVGPRRVGRDVYVGFDPIAGRWSVQDEHGVELRRIEPEALDATSICELRVTKRCRGAHATKVPDRPRPPKP
jgi:hypothetical protein